MSDIFGEISSDFLPEGFGEVESKYVQRVGVPQPPDSGHIPPGYGDPEVAAAGPNPGPTPTRMSSQEVKSYSNPAAEANRAPTPTSAPKSRTQIEREMFFGNLGDLGCMSGPVRAKNNGSALTSKQGQSPDGKYKYILFSDNSADVYDNAWKKIEHYAPGSVGSQNVINDMTAAGALSSTGTSSSSSASKTMSKKAATSWGAGLGAFTNQLLPTAMAMFSPQTALPPDLTATTVPLTTESETPWGLYAGIAGAVVVVGGLVYFMTRPSRDEE
jgi:hypothetical protein